MIQILFIKNKFSSVIDAQENYYKELVKIVYSKVLERENIKK